MLEQTPSYKYFSTFPGEDDAVKYMTNRVNGITAFSVNYITDLGLRKSVQPYLVSRLLSEELRKRATPEFGQPLDNYLSLILCPTSTSRNSLSELNFSEFTRICDYYVNRLGSWDDALRVARQFEKRISLDQNHSLYPGPRAILYLACLLAIDSDPACLDLFGNMLRSFNADVDRYLQFTVHLRQLVALVKRLDGITGIRIRNEHENIQEHIVSTYCATESETLMCQALVGNILAYHHVKNREYAEAKKISEASYQQIRDLESQELAKFSNDFSILPRYQVQVGQNWASLLLAGGNLSEALKVAQSVEGTARKGSKESLFEILCLSGLIHIKQSNYDAALILIDEAVDQLQGPLQIYEFSRFRALQMKLVCLNNLDSKDEKMEAVDRELSMYQEAFKRFGLTDQGSWNLANAQLSVG
ncbi:hypothetical protein [Ruegeria conchae]|uniref:hypothetical protein n=1 Tax=Ruegeria conchae TaxID=981384 RepID=UPI0029C60F75|nr:hypothetical protein [Ruegeria conchae]